MKLGRELPRSSRPNNSEFTQGCQQFIVPQAKMESSLYNTLAMDSVLKKLLPYLQRVGRMLVKLAQIGGCSGLILTNLKSKP